MINRFREAIESGEFAVTFEVIPGRGANEPAQIKEFEEAVKVYQTGRVHGISITDNPGGNPAVSAAAIAAEFQKQDIPALIHYAMKDKSRNQIQGDMYAMQAAGLDNLMVMTGDYQYSGWSGRSKPVFDLDPVQALQMIADMNEGLKVQKGKNEVSEIGANFFAGAVVSPFKWTEAEIAMQYMKMEKKILSGARFIISQLGYDARKMEELVMYVRERGFDTPLIANIYVITAGTANFMHNGNIPGGYMSDEFLAILKEEAKAEDKGKAARHLRAAKMVAISRGLGYQGIHIGGNNLTEEIVNYILDTADEIQDDWRKWAAELHYGQANGYYLYAAAVDEEGKPTGLNASKHSPLTESHHGKKGMMRGYGLSRFFHHWVLTEDKRFFGILRAMMAWRENKKGLHRHHGMEHLAKTVLYGCMDCGDCGLEPAIYTCPMTKCPKCQRNGPCGGSADGWCEVYPNEQYCIYYKAYLRLKKYDEVEKKLDAFITPPNNWDFAFTSGWSNYTHKRDNTAYRQYLPARDVRAQAFKDGFKPRAGKVE